MWWLVVVSGLFVAYAVAQSALQSKVSTTYRRAALAYLAEDPTEGDRLADEARRLGRIVDKWFKL